MLIAIEGIVMCFVLLIVCVVGIANGPVGLVLLYEDDVQQRVVELGLTTKEKIRRNFILCSIALFVPMFSKKVDVGTLFNPASTPEALGGAIQGCVDALHSVALIQVVCVIAGIAVCFLLPKIYENKEA